jgi:transposase
VDAITVELRLPGLKVLDIAESWDRIEVATEYQSQEAACPHCGRSTWRVHERRRQCKRDAELWSKPVWIVIWKRRFRAWLMHRNVERLRPEEGERLAQALTGDPVLATAWRLKEGLNAVYRKRTREAAAAALASWQVEASNSTLRPFQRSAATLRRWQEEVLNYWDYPITNAMVEGKHNRVKVLKRRAYGYRNDRTFSLRILNLFHT